MWQALVAHEGGGVGLTIKGGVKWGVFPLLPLSYGVGVN
jgi:hypothetical protein